MPGVSTDGEATMGSWGAGVYADDEALDLRATVAAVAKLPLSDEALLGLLRASNPSADDREDEGHTTFWLVVADQLARRGCYPEAARRMALEIIASGADLRNLERLGATAADVRRREAELERLRLALERPAPRPRKTLTAPQAFTFALGEVFAYPTSAGSPINPYFSTKALDRGWSQDGWGMAVVVEVGREFSHLAWHRLLVAHEIWREKPTLSQAWATRGWSLRAPATCSPLRRRRLEADTLGYVQIKGAELDRRRPYLSGGAFRSARSAVLADICLSNDLMRRQTQPSRFWQARPPHVVRRLDAIARP